MQYTLHLTNQCNFACDYCNVAKGSAAMSEETAFSAVDHALTRAQAAGNRKICLSFYGGEPLLQRALICSVVNYCAIRAAETGIRFTYRMTTNGVLLDEDFLTFAQANKFKLALSIDGTEAVHNRHRFSCDGAPTFCEVSAAAARLLAHFPNAYAMLTVNPDTAAALCASVQSVYALGFRTLLTTPNFSVAWTEQELDTLAAQYQALAAWYAERLLAGESLRLPLFDNKLVNAVTPALMQDKCVPARNGVSVFMNGEIFPCTQYAYHAQYAIGRVSHAIDESALAKIRTAAAISPEECQACALRERCDNRCGCRNLATTGHINRVSPLFCAHERMLIPLADALGAQIFIPA